MKALSALLFCLLTNCPLPAAIAGTSDKPPDNSPALPPQEQILDCVKRVTGLNAFLTVEEIERTSLSEFLFPFSQQFKDTIAIRVCFSPGKFKWRIPLKGDDDPYVRQFSVYLDANANSVLAVTSRISKGSPGLHPESPPKAWGIPLSRTHSVTELYDSFPTVDPKITFIEALEEVRERGIGNPLLAQELDAFYLMYANPTEKPHPVWIINMRRFPPERFSHPISQPAGEGGKSEDIKYPRRRDIYHRDYVDAITGRWMFESSNSWSP